MISPSTVGFTRYSAALDARPAMVREPSPPERPKPRLLDRVREAIRARHYSRRTEKSYVAWVRRYVLFHGKRHPAEMGAPEVTRFLNFLAVDRSVAASTQNQALSALLFLYREVLDQDLPWLDDLVRAQRPPRLPVVLTRDEVRAIIERLSGVPCHDQLLSVARTFARSSQLIRAVRGLQRRPSIESAGEVAWPRAEGRGIAPPVYPDTPVEAKDAKQFRRSNS